MTGLFYLDDAATTFRKPGVLHDFHETDGAETRPHPGPAMVRHGVRSNAAFPIRPPLGKADKVRTNRYAGL